MIRHIVLTRFRTGTPETEISDIYAGLSALTETLSGARNFTGGRSTSPEKIERGYKHAFVIDFDTWADLQRYAVHPTHKALGDRLIAAAEGGIDGILVLDLEV